MDRFLLEITSQPGHADSDLLDNLAERADEVAELENLTLGLNEDGSFTGSFEMEAASAREAADRGFTLLVNALHDAEPNGCGDETLERLHVGPSERQLVH